MLGALIAVVGLAAMLLGPTLAHVRIIAPTTGLLVFVAGALLGLLAAALGAWHMYSRGFTPIAVVALGGLLPVTVLVIAALPAFRYPRINDISTDTQDPPGFVHAQELPENRGRDMAFPESFVGDIEKAYPDLEPLTLSAPPETAYSRVIKAAEAMAGWEITRRDTDAWAIEAVATTWLFQFRDDIVIRVRRGAEDGSIVDVRSKSRDGQGDLGANAKRIRAYLAKLSET